MELAAAEPLLGYVRLDRSLKSLQGCTLKVAVKDAKSSSVLEQQELRELKSRGFLFAYDVGGLKAGDYVVAVSLEETNATGGTDSARNDGRHGGRPSRFGNVCFFTDFGGSGSVPTVRKRGDRKMKDKADIGLIGLAVMGENLILNMESKGFSVAWMVASGICTCFVPEPRAPATPVTPSPVIPSATQPPTATVTETPTPTPTLTPTSTVTPSLSSSKSVLPFQVMVSVTASSLRMRLIVIGMD